MVILLKRSASGDIWNVRRPGRRNLPQNPPPLKSGLEKNDLAIRNFLAYEANGHKFFELPI